MLMGNVLLAVTQPRRLRVKPSQRLRFQGTVILLLSLACSGGGLFAQTHEGAGETVDEVADNELHGSPMIDEPVMIEEIVITEIRSPRLWRLNIERAEDDVYALFNRLTDNSDYKVDCRREGTTQSRILVRSCEPRFVSRRRALNTRNMIVDWRSDDEDPVRGMENAINNKYVDERDLQHELAAKYEEMNQAMMELALENPELMQALTRLGQLRAAYQDSVISP